MARKLHLSSYNPLMAGERSYVLDDSPTRGDNRREYSKLEDALDRVKAYGRDRMTILVIHHLDVDEGEFVRKRLSAFPKIEIQKDER